MSKKYTIDELLQIMRQLRDPVQGCPWDIEQTTESLTRYTIEECYELIDAIEQGEDSSRISEELGDVLLQVIFYCQIADEKKQYDFSEVVDLLAAKLIRRHPHVFSELVDNKLNTQQVVDNWDAIKEQERTQSKPLFEDIAAALPALMRSQKIQKRAAKLGFDYRDALHALSSMRAEIEELEQAITAYERGAQDKEKGTAKQSLVDEIGDVLFSCVNVARHLELNAEDSLRTANRKFVQRIRAVEQQLSSDDTRPTKHHWLRLSDEQKHILWQRAKVAASKQFD